MIEERESHQESALSRAPLFQGSRKRRVGLLLCALLMAVLLALGPAASGSPMDWANWGCIACGVTSTLLAAVLMAVDLIRPQALTSRALRRWIRVMVCIPLVAIAFAIIGFFV